MNLTNNIRYKIFPQMIEYDSMASGKYVPYAMLAGPSDYKGSRINTDKHGFRITQNDSNYFRVEDIEKYDEINILVGGSTTFGVGSTSDSNTISSIVSKNKKEVWLNLGIRGCNSFQEIIHLNRVLYKAKKVKKIVFLSGVNDLYLRIVNNTITDFDFGFGTKFTSIAAFHPYRQALSVFFASIYNTDPLNIVDKNILEMISWPFHKSKYKENKDERIFSIEQKIEMYLELYKRNFELYKGFSLAYNCEVHFIFQPLLFWSDKQISKNEILVVNYLDELQKSDYWGDVKRQINDSKVSNKIHEKLNVLSKNLGFTYFNSNKLFTNISDDCFVDSVHLTDFGNKLIADYISNI
jgi:hypothetical protein